VSKIGNTRSRFLRHQLNHHLNASLLWHPQVQDENNVEAKLLVKQASFLSVASMADNFQTVFQRKDRN
jgi:hypothetical protein